MKSRFFLALFIFFVFSQYHCGKNPVKVSRQETGELRLWAHIVKQSSGLAKSLATTWDSLVIRISPTASSPDMDAMIRTVKFTAADPFVNYTMSDVPAGKGRLVELWTKNSKDLVIHTSPGKKVDLVPGEIRTLDFTLFPKRGSIYITIADIPLSAGNDTIALMHASFVFQSQTLCDSVKRSKNAFLTIDNVPDSSSGTLSVFGIGKSGDTLYRSSMPFTFFAMRDTTVSIQAAKVSTGASMSMALTALSPAATVISVSLDSMKSNTAEKGPCVITEIMYSANDSEYIEIYNPLASDTSFDTLILEIDGIFRYFSNISIQSKGFFVFGRKILPWVDATHTTNAALDLSSSGGNVITLRAKDSTVMDRVAFEGGANKQEWPNLSPAKKSIVLDSIVSDPAYNNFGKNWVAAQTPINSIEPGYALPITVQYGTPGHGGE